MSRSAAAAAAAGRAVYLYEATFSPRGEYGGGVGRACATRLPWHGMARLQVSTAASSNPSFPISRRPFPSREFLVALEQAAPSLTSGACLPITATSRPIRRP